MAQHLRRHSVRFGWIFLMLENGLYIEVMNIITERWFVDLDVKAANCEHPGFKSTQPRNI
jgi:hypothetical protein